jgi:hypothetical protein
MNMSDPERTGGDVMASGWTRRGWVRACASAAAGLASVGRPGGEARAIDYEKPVPGSEALTAYQNGSQVFVRWANTTLAAYRALPTERYPYFSPLTGPVSGLPLTTESSLPYPHHRGLWLGCEPLNGGDYWGDGPLDSGQIRSVELRLGAATRTSLVFTDRCDWSRPGGPSPFEDRRTFTITVPGERLRLLDVDITLRAADDVRIARAKHSFFALRCAPDLAPMYGGVLANSEGGVGAKETYGKAAAWCGFHGRRAGRPDVVEGIALMDHPENPWSPTPWLTRDYGHLSPSPFYFRPEPWRLAKGGSIRLRYRVVLHAGTPKEAGLDALYQSWVDS